ncbi:MAG TPA: 16S rRNA (adenine(1518)-N(6)/adenine(1519)-N(6))-dimethyltransferase RsmA [Bacteroides sp.]|nr:16S rRNA (adenine(1518)-N(6)/adenine(1519)-N(6))-dimethyltransferase RsmA [Bacteroides sp.]
MSVRPKKGLGQHFLKDENIAKKIVLSLDEVVAGSLLEIGPGTGVLTKYLFDKYPGMHVLEIDREAWDYLQDRFPEHRDRILLGDFLKTDLFKTLDAPISVIGNFPYNISSQIFFRILEHRQKVEEVVCMIQKEVAERISSPPGSKVYGILSVLLQAFYDIEYLFQVGPGVFDPPPRVQSAVIRLRRNSVAALDCDEAKFFSVVKTGFNQRRKTLRNSLKGNFQIPDPIPKIFSMRPEQLPVDSFVELTRLLDKK